jgi:hypothetical protein
LLDEPTEVVVDALSIAWARFGDVDPLKFTSLE